MAHWEFLDYITEGPPKKNPVMDWWGTLTPQGKADFDALVVVLSETEDWDEPKRKKYKELKGRHKGLCELILKVEGENLRPLGVLRRQQRQFVFLGGCEKHGLWTVPPEAFDNALKLKEQLDQGKGATRAHV
jgi:hypothetical protein